MKVLKFFFMLLLFSSAFSAFAQDSLHVRQLGFCSLPGQAWVVAVSGNYAYVADYGSGLRVVNITNPAAPTEVGFCDTPGYANGVAVSGNYAYVADEYMGLRVVNITNPSAPFEVGFYDTPGYALGVAVSGNYAYVADGDYGLRVVNITNHAAPVEVGFYATPEYAVGVAVSGNYAYVADEFVGLRVVNITNPAAPSEVGFYDTPGSAMGVAVSGNHAYVADGVYFGIYDCSQAICGSLPPRGEVQIVRFGAPDWGYRLVHRRGCLDRLVFTRFCPGTTGRVSGQAAANWSMLGGGDGNNGDSIIFVTTVPLTSGSVDTFWLSHPACADIVMWCAGDTCGSVDGPLPVELLSFDAVPGDAQVLLRWQTASETGSDRVEIERNGVIIHRTLAAGDATGHSYSWTDRSVANGQSYHYALWSVETNGERSLLRETDATPRPGIATVNEYALHGNYPNPFNPVTEIAFDLPEAGAVSLKVFDLMGREVAVLVNGEKPAGQHAISFDARDLPSGMYICRMTANEFTASHKMMLIE